MSENDETSEGTVSRRDFLRRAGKEAVTTGASLMPGTVLAKTLLNGAPSAKTDIETETGGEAAALDAPLAKRGVWRTLASWRHQRQQDANGETP